MTDRTPSPWLAAGALILLAFNLRLIFPSLSVVLPEIVQSTGISISTAGYLTTLPMLCLGLFAPMAPLCVRHFGIERTLVAALVLLTVGTGIRGIHGLTGLFVGSILSGACIAISNVLLPILVKRDFSSSMALVTGLYVTSMNLGSAAAAAFTVPVMTFWNTGWQTGLALWSLPTAIIALVWLPRLRIRSSASVIPHTPATIWKDPLAWQITVYMGLQSSMAYTVLGWMAPILQSRGLDATAAGIITSACIVANLVGNLVAPALIKRTADQRLLTALLSLGCGTALIGLLFAPPMWLWPLSLVLGFAQGATFATALTIIVLRSRTTAAATSLSGMAQSVGYTIGAFAPLAIGLIHHWTGSYTPIAWLLSIITLGASLSGWMAGRNRYVLD